MAWSSGKRRMGSVLACLLLVGVYVESAVEVQYRAAEGRDERTRTALSALQKWDQLSLVLPLLSVIFTLAQTSSCAQDFGGDTEAVFAAATAAVAAHTSSASEDRYYIVCSHFLSARSDGMQGEPALRFISNQRVHSRFPSHTCFCGQRRQTYYTTHELERRSRVLHRIRRRCPGFGACIPFRGVSTRLSSIKHLTLVYSGDLKCVFPVLNEMKLHASLRYHVLGLETARAYNGEQNPLLGN
jgi:hypothetical protein